MADRTGQRFGDYRLIRLLGQGSFGDVYLGEHTDDKSLAAVKVLQARLTNDDLKEFINETSTIFRMKHPHIVQLLDFGIAETPYLIMDYAPNGTLRQRHPKGTRLPLATIVTYVTQIAAALQYAHDKKRIHRDVKPDNILLGAHDEILLSDFGIAVVAHSTRSLSLQGDGGTIPYMAPEQLQGQPRSASDQYALGILVYEWLSGQRPFTGTATEIAMQHLLTPPPPLREKLPTISPDVEQVVMTALAKDPHQRFTTIQAFATAFEQACLPKTPLGTTLLTYRGHSWDVVAVAWSPDGKHIASGLDDNTVQVWDAATGSHLLTYKGHASSVVAVAWSPDGKRIASGSIDNTVQVWDAATGSHLLTYKDHASYVRAVAWSPDGRRIASGSSDKTVQVWDTVTGGNLLTYKGHSYGVNAEASRLAYISSSALTYSVHSYGVNAVAWSPDGRRIASGSSDKTVHIWDATTGSTITKRTLAGFRRRKAQVWDAITGNTIYTYREHGDRVHAVAWSPDGTRIASGSGDKTVRVWQAV